MYQQKADSIFVSELLQPADDFIIAGVAVRLSADLPNFLKGIHDYQSCVRMLFEKQLQLIFQTAPDLLCAGGKVEFLCAVHSEHPEHPILQPLVIVLQSQIEDCAFVNGIIPQRLPGADVVSKLGNQKGFADFWRTRQEIGSGVEQTVDDRRPAGIRRFIEFTECYGMEVGGIGNSVKPALNLLKIFFGNFIRVIDFGCLTCYNADRVIEDRLFPVCANRRNRNSRFSFLIDHPCPPSFLP